MLLLFYRLLSLYSSNSSWVLICGKNPQRAGL
jgi:hypothetical protein